jgi:hypothetical protein
MLNHSTQVASEGKEVESLRECGAMFQRTEKKRADYWALNGDTLKDVEEWREKWI